MDDGGTVRYPSPRGPGAFHRVPDLPPVLQAVFDRSPDVVLVVDAQGTVLHANDRITEVLGWSVEEVCGRELESLVPQDVHDRHRWHRAAFRARPRPTIQPHRAGQDVRGRHRDGTDVPVEVSLTPMDELGPGLVLCQVRDLSRRVGDQLLYRQLLDAAPDAMLVVDEVGRILIANRQVTTTYGWTEEDLVGQPMERLLPPDLHAGGREEALGAIAEANGEPAHLGESRGLRRDGSVFPSEVIFSPVPTSQGVRVCISVRDLTERLALAAEADQLREELVATVSHELRTPLTSIVGYTELLLDLPQEELGPVARRMVEVIDRSAERELRLVDDLLTVGMIHADDLPVRLEPLELAPLVRQVVEEAQVRACPEGVDLRMVVDDVPPVLGDGGRIGQVLQNLLSNALKFSRSGGRVEVALQADHDSALLQVSDTGIGIAQDQLDKVFQRLHRAPEAVEAQAPGAGLGLAIVRAIVDAHEGRIEVDSALGRGTVVRVRLPLLLAPEGAQTPRRTGR